MTVRSDDVVSEDGNSTNALINALRELDNQNMKTNQNLSMLLYNETAMYWNDSAWFLNDTEMWNQTEVM